MLGPLSVPTLRQFGLALAGAASAGFGVLLPEHAAVAAGLCAWWAVVGASRHGVAALAAALPALALLPGGGWLALATWTLVAALGMRVLAGERAAADEQRVRELRAELRDAEHERQVLHRHIQRYPVLLESCLELSAARDLDQLSMGLCLRARDLVPNLACVRVFLGTSEQPKCRASSDAEGRPCPRDPGPDERYVAAEARLLIHRDHDRVRVLVPLRGDRRRVGDQDTLRGVLEVGFRTTEIGDRMVLELLGALGRLGGLGLAAVDLLTQARGLALRDELTGLYGQHEFLRRLDEQAASCRRHGLQLGVLMCDMDHLKRFNDTFGHPAGDGALRAVAQAMRSALPGTAIACRYGGEEFAALIPGVAPDALAALAERVRAAIATAIPDPAHVERRVTASIGHALLGADETARATLARADAACYAAKDKGRNRVEAAP